MNPEKRFGQIEEILTDVVIKVDRLADGQGKLLEHVTQQAAELEKRGAEINELKETVNNLDAKVGTIAQGLTNLTVENQREHRVMNDKLDEILGLLRAKLI